MFLHSEFFNILSWKKYFSLKILLFLIADILIVIDIQGQTNTVFIYITVVPPYSSKINDYVSQPNKVIVTFTSLFDQTVYVSGKISEIKNGVEIINGIMVATDPSYKVPLNLKRGTVRINMDNLPVFDANHLICRGINKNDLLYGSGLPEGDYRICLRAYASENPNQTISPEAPQGCSNIISIKNLEPPVIIQPICGKQIPATLPQTINFIWTRPPGAAFNTEFNLKIIEVLPNDRNINDAVKSAMHPVFFEKTVSINFYQLGPSDPALVPGKRYAFVITAIDPAKKNKFRNNGMSAVCSFSYGITELPTHLLTGNIKWSFADSTGEMSVHYPLIDSRIELWLRRLSDTANASANTFLAGTSTSDLNGNFTFQYKGELSEDCMPELVLKNPYFSINKSFKDFFRKKIDHNSFNKNTSFNLGEFFAQAKTCRLKAVVKDSLGQELKEVKTYILRPNDFYTKDPFYKNLKHEIEVIDSTANPVTGGRFPVNITLEDKLASKCNEDHPFLINPVIIKNGESGDIFSRLFFNNACSDRYIIMFWFNIYENYSFYLDLKEPLIGQSRIGITVIEKTYILK